MFQYTSRVCLTLAFTITFVAGQSQSKLAIGDKMPDVILTNVMNNDQASFNLSALKGKFIVLDFWNHNCRSCLKAFPAIDSLQKAFQGQVQFVLLNREDQAFTERFFREKKRIKMPSVPMATGSQRIIDLFPSDGYPYSVWIDSNLIIRQMAHMHNLTKEHIARFIEGKPLDINNAARKVHYGSLLDYKGDDLYDKLKYFSCVTQCVSGLNVGAAERGPFGDSLIEISSNCTSIVDLYKRAFREGDRNKFNEPGSVVVEAIDIRRYQKPSNPNEVDAWSRTNSYNYTLLLPLARKSNAYQLMRQDLERYFGLKASIERKILNGKPTDVLILKE